MTVNKDISVDVGPSRATFEYTRNIISDVIRLMSNKDKWNL